MKPLQTALLLALLIGLCNFIPSEQSEVHCHDKLHSEDSCSSIDSPEQLPLSHACVRITFNGKKDDRAPIVILPGFNAFKEMYMELAQYLALKTAREVCVVDLRNHGDSPWSDETDSKVMASDVELFMKTLNTDKLVVIGHSMGGKVAVEFALTYPDKVEKVVVEDMRPNGMSEEALKIFDTNLDWMRGMMKIISEGATECEAKKEILNYYRTLFERVNETLDLDERFVEYIPIKCSEGKCTWKSNLDVLDTVFKDPLKFWHDSSGKTEKPVLFIHGETSRFKVGDVKEEILDLFPEATLLEVKGRGHILNPYPEFRKEVVNFINARD